jgi:predicted NBD/HSP70 family sugar kinase
LREVRGRGAVSRAELESATGLSRSAVAAAAADLLAAGLIGEERNDCGPPRGRGRRAALLHPTRPAGYVAGIDFGHMHVRVAVAETSGRVVAEDIQTIDVDRNAAAALDEAARLVAALFARARVADADLLSVAAGIPGPLDRRRQIVISPTILSSWIHFAPAAELGRRLGREVVIGNDADMGAIGEKRFGGARGYADFLYIKASHGIGASIVTGGRCYLGSRGFAGEIGHTQLPGALNHCRCGNRGCLESVISVPEIRRQLGRTHLGGDPALTDAARDPVGSRVLADAGRMVGRVVADGCNWLNPEAVILGGELGVSGSPFAEGVRESLDRYAQPATARAVTVAIAGLGSRAEVMGAVATAIDRCAVE